MRFIENGPSIPDDLLLARDEGRVVFFCGAGVSRAKAGLVDFYGLAESVLNNLRVQADHVAHSVLHEAKLIGNRTGSTGLISADRIFGLLERDFYIQDIETAVASSLKPKADVDLSAHRILLDLATTSEGSLRLVTTNFDRLFEEASDKQHTLWLPSKLHGSANLGQLNGIVHLHGIVDNEYSHAESDGFILTSSQFGRAYLTEGWATRFFKEILDQFVVVFVGYTADDPPVQYLLEALNTRKDRITEVYAFQAGSETEANGMWQHKGVEAIAFNSEDMFCALWDSLEIWAKRARSPDAWVSSVIQLASLSPMDLQPFERGQVAHVISTTEGARQFAQAEKVPPADWLCVFDPARRYESSGTDLNPDHFFESYVIDDNQNPEQQGINLGKKPSIDPFIIYGLDSDSRFNSPENSDRSFQSNIPGTAWDAFVPTNRDRQNLQFDYAPSFRDQRSINPLPLCTRLRSLSLWLSKVADQPAAIWWASKQSVLHPEIQREILNSSKLTNTVMRQAWHYLFEFWNHQLYQNQYFQDSQDIKTAVNRDGWSYQLLRKYIVLQRPFIQVSPHFWHKCSPPDPRENLLLNDMLSFSIEYPDQIQEIEVNDELLAIYTSEFRKNLEYIVFINKEIGRDDDFNIGSILAPSEYIEPNSLFNQSN
ncbi:MAG: SIR2 family protein [Methylococcaceae bacterium]|nr:SIR2 family protein [Methylococcaceae bacterium]